MTRIRHGSIPEWYNKDSKHYDTFNENTPTSTSTNRTVEKILRQHKASTVLDLTCGTGSQVFWLAKRGFKLTGSDISPGMLRVARKKAQQEGMDIAFIRGDMRTIRVGSFDAAISIFNAIGHLTKAGFEKTMRNVGRNLNPGGLYIFDIFNLNYLKHENNITKLTIDWLRREGKTQLREVQHSILDSKGLLVSYTTSYEQKGSGNPRESKGVGTLQLYSAKELQAMLKRNGFKVVEQCGLDGSRFSDTETERIVTIAKRA